MSLETAEEFACKRIPYIRNAADDNIDLLESVLARDVEARDKAVALRVLIDIRDSANAELKGKGLSMSPCEAIANAWHAAFDKYEEAT